MIRITDPIQKVPTPDRNDKCPCLSGKKYKKCCLIKSEQLERTELKIFRKNTRR